MNSQEKDRIKLQIVHGWISKADIDIKTARVLLAQEPCLTYPVCFHCQQAAEKYLKAYCSYRQIEFPKTHSIRKLLSLIKPYNQALAEELSPSAILTPYGGEIRYPSDMPEPTIQEAREAYLQAQSVQSVVLRFIPDPDS